MKSITKILLLTIILLSPLLAIKATEDTRGVVAFELLDETVLHEEKGDKGLFRDINITLSLFKSADKNITIDSIKSYNDKFKPLDKNEKFQDTDVTHWLKIDFESRFPNGTFVASYGDAKVLKHSFIETQKVEQFTLGGIEHLKFTYDKAKDNPSYYFKLAKGEHTNAYRFLYITSDKEFYKGIDKRTIIMMTLGFILGLIIMAGLYNGAMYYYNRDISFLYYMLMQWSIALVLFNMTGIISFTDLAIARSEIYYALCSLLGAFFTTLFTKSFLDTKIYSPKLDKMLNLFILLILIDAIISIFYVSFIAKYHLLPFFALTFIYLGYKRVKQGFKPALFYLAGWSVLVITLFLDAFWVFDFIVNPFFLGTAVEAIFFSLALSYKIKMIADEKEQQKELLIHQSRLASMGEMIGNIAHQWRQPLTYLSYSFMNLKEAQKHGELDVAYLDKKVDDATVQLEFMSQTIDDFRDFYAPHKEKERFFLAKTTNQTLEIMRNMLDSNKIEIELNIKVDAEIENYKNEYKQVLLNLISNAKDALIERAIVSPKIIITIDKNLVSIEDNAGGIKPQILPRIFEPYFSTKEGNSGIGLYMSKMIVERNMGGKLRVWNGTEGAVFEVCFKAPSFLL